MATKSQPATSKLRLQAPPPKAPQQPSTATNGHAEPVRDGAAKAQALAESYGMTGRNGNRWRRWSRTAARGRRPRRPGARSYPADPSSIFDDVEILRRAVEPKISVNPELVNVTVGRPGSACFFRSHPDPKFTIPGYLLSNKDENESCFVAPDIAH